MSEGKRKSSWRKAIRGIGIALGLMAHVASGNAVSSDHLIVSSKLELNGPTEVQKWIPGKEKPIHQIKICALKPSGPYTVDVKLLNGWHLTDGMTEWTVKCNPEGEYYFDVVRGLEEYFQLYLCDSDHVNTAELKATGAYQHRIFLYPCDKTGAVVVPQDILWECAEEAYHRRTGKVPFNTNQLKTGYVLRPVVKNGVFSMGRYEEDYTADWAWYGCLTEECRTHAVFETAADVYRLSLVNGSKSSKETEALGLGLDMTDAGKVENRGSTFPIKAVIEDEYEHKKEFRWSIGKKRQDKEFTSDAVVNFEVEREKKEPHLPTLFGKTGPVESERLTCEARISGCHETCTAEAMVSTNVTVVGVDVTIEMADCEKKTDTDKLLGYAWSESEKIEETQGAFIHYEDDHGMEPFSPRGSNALTRVWFSVKPDNLPNDDKIHLSFPEKALWEGSQSRGKMVYTPAKPEYTVGALKNKSFYLHGHKPSETICDHEITIEHVKSGAKDCAKYTVVELDLVPDFDRDHVINTNDEKKVVQQKTFYWWINNDDDEGDCSSHIADEGHELAGSYFVDNTNSRVDGRTDLLDFFPIWTNITQADRLCNSDEAKNMKAKLTLKLNSSGLGYVQTGDLTKEEAGNFLWEDSAVADNPKKLLHEARVRYDENEEFQKKYLEIVRKSSDKGILIVEGRETGAKMQLELCRGGTPVVSVSLKCDVRDVRKMISHLNLYDSSPRFTKCEIDDPDFQTGDGTVVYFHGFKVSGGNAEGWNTDAFKRLYQSGSNAKFIGVAWPGIEDDSLAPGLYFHRNAYQAFQSAKKFADFYKERFAEKRMILMAHSLGNMLVSSAIQDYEGVNPNCYFMLNGAVASEAYDEKRYNPMGGIEQCLVNFRWKKTEESDPGYPLVAYCTEWHRLYEGDETEAGKSRAALTWKGRFKDVCQRSEKVINYSSEGDEVFEISKDKEFCQITGNRFAWVNWCNLHNYDASQFCWQKQEVYKGVSAWDWMKDSDEGGWGFNPKEGCSLRDADVNEEKRAYTRAALKDMTYEKAFEVLKMKPAFNVNPTAVFMGRGVVLKEEQDRLLSCAIPAISLAMGNVTGEFVGGIKNKDLQKMRKKWGRTDKRYQDRWLHCDLKDMAYFYNKELWDNMVEEGNLK